MKMATLFNKLVGFLLVSEASFSAGTYQRRVQQTGEGWAAAGVSKSRGPREEQNTCSLGDYIQKRVVPEF